jgi:hypothetical protein
VGSSYFATYSGKNAEFFSRSGHNHKMLSLWRCNKLVFLMEDPFKVHHDSRGSVLLPPLPPDTRRDFHPAGHDFQGGPQIC